jgi:predicted acyl esterase
MCEICAVPRGNFLRRRSKTRAVPLARRAHSVSAFGVPPYPTLIEYSGYGYADPSGPVNGIAVLANLMGFAVVDVNMRGTGCSGGAYDFFEPL